MPATSAAPAAAAATANGATASATAAPVELPEPPAWPAFVAAMQLSGMALQLAAQTALKSASGSEIALSVPEASRHLTEKPYADMLRTALEQALRRRVRLRFEIGAVAEASLAIQEKRERDAAQVKTEAAFRDDPFVQDLLSRFEARIKPNSIKPV